MKIGLHIADFTYPSGPATGSRECSPSWCTLDVLSKGRAMLGIGAAWNGEEAAGLGLPFPDTAERFERLEETLQICLQMWSEDDSPYRGRHYQLERTLNVPQPIRRPPVMLPLDPGERGEKIEDLLAQLRGMAALGVEHAHGWVPQVWQTARLELLGKEVVPAVAAL